MKVGDWVRVYSLPSLTADREGVVVSPYHTKVGDLPNLTYWQIDLGDRVWTLEEHRFKVINTTPEEILGEEYFE